MELRILDKDEEQIRFILKDVDVAFANALRRTILTEVPALAIDEVVIVENSSALYDEILAHRLGLIPLKTDLDTLGPKDKCSCGGVGCASCQVEYVLRKEAIQEPVMVFSGDLETNDPKMKPAVSTIPIVKLAPGQKIELEAFARLGTGKEHVKWQPTGTVAYRYMPIIEVDREKSDERDKALVDVCPKKIFFWDENGLGLTNVIECILCNMCVEKCETHSVTVRFDDRTFIFKVESTGALTPEEIVEQAVNILLKKVKEFNDQISLLRPGASPTP
ncbi:MAG: DNA-directed RNA polymerase subunit D [Candidatus Ranarchaeia archaeon]